MKFLTFKKSGKFTGNAIIGIKRTKKGYIQVVLENLKIIKFLSISEAFSFVRTMTF